MNKMEMLLSILQEECCELAVEISKAKRFGVHEQRDLPTSNAERMQKEYNDILAMLDMISEHDPALSLHRDEDLIEAKREKVQRYLQYSRELGTLVEDGTTPRIVHVNDILDCPQCNSQHTVLLETTEDAGTLKITNVQVESSTVFDEETTS